MSTHPASSYGNSLPRKCAIIRRTYQGDDVEKTELRFVSYRRPGGELNKTEFFGEVEQFLREQMEDMGKKENESQLTVSTHRQKERCSVKKAIRSLERLIQYYTQMSQSSTDPQYGILKMTIESVLTDVRKCGEEVDSTLMERIRMLNKIRMTNSESTD